MKTSFIKTVEPDMWITTSEHHMMNVVFWRIKNVGWIGQFLVKQCLTTAYSKQNKMVAARCRKVSVCVNITVNSRINGSLFWNANNTWEQLMGIIWKWKQWIQKQFMFTPAIARRFRLCGARMDRQKLFSPACKGIRLWRDTRQSPPVRPFCP